MNQTAGAYTDGGIAHGVVDASLAVELAKNWATVGGQQSELTFTTAGLAGKIWPAFISNQDTGEFLVPGGVAGDGDNQRTFGQFYNQFGDDTPFVDDDGVPDEDPPQNDRDFGSVFTGQPGIPLGNIPPMSVEWVEVNLNLGPSTPNDLDFLRVTLVSPDGTNSELNVFGQNVPNGVDHNDGIGSFSDAPGDLGTTNLILSTNRDWGERTEPKLRVDEAGNPVRNFFGQTVTDGWRLVFENYGSTEIDISSFEVAFHGSDASGTGRIQGAIGVDENADGFFSDSTGTADNFTRFVGTGSGRIFNPDQEAFAGGVMVYVDLDSDGVRDNTEPSFQTGNDGNYFFDLPPGTYDVRIDDTMLPENLDNLQNLQTGPLTTVTINAVGDRVTPQLSPNDPAVAGLNAKLVPNLPQVATTFSISGVVFADLDGDGVQGGDDGVVEGAQLFLDVNQNAVYDPAVDPLATTAADGTYTLTTNPVVPPDPGFYSVFVIDGSTGAFSIATNPSDSEQATFAQLGDTIEDIDFGFRLRNEDDPVDPFADPNAPGAIAGVVFVDANGNGTREDEGGANGITVYIDANDNEILDAGEEFRVTSSNGSYSFNSLPPATYVVRIETSAAFSQTAPASGKHTVNLQPGLGATERDFGILSLATNDFGDLPSQYAATTLADDGARHLISNTFFLGTEVDGELDGVETTGADGDDMAFSSDEDGIDIDPLFDTSSSLRLVATANANGGYLQGWLDFNEDGDFDDAGEHVVFKNAPMDATGVTKKLLAAGANELFVDVPTAALTSGTVYARFRYGEFEIEGIHGFAQIGEVEDYAIPVQATNPGLQAVHGPDFNEDGVVDGLDFLAWQHGFGKTTNVTAADGDADSNGVVDGDDLAMWTQAFGDGTASAATTAAVVAAGDGSASETLPTATNTYLAAAVVQDPVQTSAETAPTATTLSLSSPATQTANTTTVVPTVETANARVDLGAGREAALRSFANEGRLRADVAQRFVQLQRSQAAESRFEYEPVDTSFSQPLELVDSSFSLRDRAVDHWFAERRHPLVEETPLVLDRRRQDDQQDGLDDETALAFALDEEIDWRF